MSFFILNADNVNGEVGRNRMLVEGIAAACCEHSEFAPRNTGKNIIQQFGTGDYVFLCGTNEGIIAYGMATGMLLKEAYQCNDKLDKEGLFYQELSHFKVLRVPLTYAEINTVLARNLGIKHTLTNISSHDGYMLLGALRLK